MMMKKSEDMDKAEESEGPSVSKWVHQGWAFLDRENLWHNNWRFIITFIVIAITITKVRHEKKGQSKGSIFPCCVFMMEHNK